jgi:hypothetical protein
MTKIEVGKTYKFKLHVDPLDKNRLVYIGMNGPYRVYLSYVPIGKQHIRNIKYHEDFVRTSYVIATVKSISTTSSFVEIYINSMVFAND